MQENVPTTLVLQSFFSSKCQTLTIWEIPPSPLPRMQQQFLALHSKENMRGGGPRYHLKGGHQFLEKPKSLKMKERIPRRRRERKREEEEHKTRRRRSRAKKVSYSQTFCCTVELHPNLINPFLMRKRRSWPLKKEARLRYCDSTSLRIQQRQSYK